MRVFYRGGIRVQDGDREVVLDPRKATPDAVVSHGHLDHLSPGAHMTAETLDVMRVRLGREDGVGLRYGQEAEVGGLGVSLVDAGHVFGSAMIRVEDLLYSGDVNPNGGPTCGTCEPQPCDTLVLEATYGKPGMVFPPKEEVLQDLLAWLEDALETGPVALGGYEFGKAQELVAVANKLDVPVVVPDRVGDLAEVYRRHGHDLRFLRATEAEEAREGSYVLVAPSRAFRRPAAPAVQEVLDRGGRTAFTSGWCALYDFRRSHELDAQFPLSDHGDLADLLWFVEACNPRVVYTCFGYAEELARTIRSRLGRRAAPLPRGWF